MGNAQGGMGGMPGMGGSGGGAQPNTGAGGSQQQPRFDTAQGYQDPDPAAFLPGGTPVYVNVYHLMPGPQAAINGALMGLGVFHSGVEVAGAEFAFGGDASSPERPGVFQHPPKAILPAPQFHRSHHVGNLPKNVTLSQVQSVSHELGDAKRGGWTCGSYNLMLRNCNHFAEAFVGELSKRFVEPAGGVPLVYPGYINRAAKMGTGLVPPQMLAMFQQAAPKAPGAFPEGNNGGSSPQQHPYQQQQQQQQQRSPPPTGASAAPKPAAKPAAEPKPAPQAAATNNNAAAPPAAKTEAELGALSAKALRDLAKAHGIDPRTLLEKQDYMEAILAAQRRRG
eukprot:CAMPEP_0174850784 /NCGR_PEP_ID=MMETSP1114-20130205/21137_1 /TAXON_ID=312471 /ORGANISM="Neobodo designis, Strain CCAP 1951/1" /LENGTH=337 /DNA_ID=CAMNT_0016085271 /DNA_START=60 /DNA_END=1073 /DNA_ORIENTATION=+